MLNYVRYCISKKYLITKITSMSSLMALFDRSHMTYYEGFIVTTGISLFHTITDTLLLQSSFHDRK